MEADRSDDKVKDKKRTRDEPGLFDSPLSDIKSSPDAPVVKRNRVDLDNSCLASPEILIRDDFFDILEDSDGSGDRDPTIHGLDSVIKSFEDEILVPEDLEMGSESVVPPTELGYLLEASDDELGLPPSFGSSEEAGELPATFSDDFGFADSLSFADEMPNYDSFEYGISVHPEFGSGRDGNCTEFVALGGLFDNGYSFDGGDVSELLWRPETLPAV